MSPPRSVAGLQGGHGAQRLTVGDPVCGEGEVAGGFCLGGILEVAEASRQRLAGGALEDRDIDNVSVSGTALSATRVAAHWNAR